MRMHQDMPDISILICTFNRARYLEKVLLSLERQTISQDRFEVILINDGSSDDTPCVADHFRDRLPLRYLYHDNAGLAASKNIGISEATSPIVLFMDDDDIAMPELLEEHIQVHHKYPDENYAVLGYTELDKKIDDNPLMEYVTKYGCFLFSYPSLQDGDILDYKYFWGGRTSCKTGYLKRYGVFNPVFNFGCEDIELGYRLSLHNLKVVYHKKAKSIMIRLLSIDDFFRRLIKQGKSQYILSKIHDTSEIKRWAEIDNAEEIWRDVAGVFEQLLNSARKLDLLVNTRIEEGLDIDDYTTQLLHRSYWNAFNACKLKGINQH